MASPGDHRAMFGDSPQLAACFATALALGLLSATSAAQEPPPAPPPASATPPVALPPPPPLAAPFGQPPPAPPSPGWTAPPPAGAPPPPQSLPPPPGFTVAPVPYGAPPGAPPGYDPYGPRKLPDVMPYAEGQPIPPGYVVVERSHMDVAAIGGALFLVGYLPAVYVGALAGAANSSSLDGSDDDFAPLYIPVAGPFATIESANANATGAFWLVLLGAAQTAGVVVGITGLAMPDDPFLYRRDLALSVTPVVTAEQQGLAVSGAF